MEISSDKKKFQAFKCRDLEKVLTYAEEKVSAGHKVATFLFKSHPNREFVVIVERVDKPENKTESG